MNNKKSELSIIEKAKSQVQGFNRVYDLLQQNVILKDQSESTFSNYCRYVAAISLQYGRLPENINDEEINEYLVDMVKNSQSRSKFKHAVYGLRNYYRIIGLKNRALKLPKVKHDTRLPVILNRTEMRELLSAPKLLKHRIVLALIYSAGLRSSEVLNLKLIDIDFERMSLHICQSKNKKDRVVPLSEYLAEGIKMYIDEQQPKVWLINGTGKDGRFSSTGLRHILGSSLKNTNIQKKVNIHSLRHSYATHLLEDGVNIQKIQLLLGHSELRTTMVYLHIAQCPETKVHSPLDSLYGLI